MDDQPSLFVCGMFGNLRPRVTDDAPDPLPYEGQRDAAALIERASKQNRLLFERLRRGPASNHDLAAISLKYTSRISDLRKLLEPIGWTIECYDQDRKTGLSWYRLSRNNDPEPQHGPPFDSTHGFAATERECVRVVSRVPPVT